MIAFSSKLQVNMTFVEWMSGVMGQVSGSQHLLIGWQIVDLEALANKIFRGKSETERSGVPRLEDYWESEVPIEAVQPFHKDSRPLVKSHLRSHLTCNRTSPTAPHGVSLFQAWLYSLLESRARTVSVRTWISSSVPISSGFAFAKCYQLQS